jgi:hypothetical protein
VSYKNVVSGEKQLTGKLLVPTVCHLKLPAQCKHFNIQKYSCNRKDTWIFPEHAITLVHCALTIYNTMYLHEQLTYIMEL